MTGEFLNECEKVGSEFMPNVKDEDKLATRRREIQQVNDLVYLGQLLSFEDRLNKELTRRKEAAWKNYWSLKKFKKVTLAENSKSKS